jgi:hypothetical protein
MIAAVSGRPEFGVLSLIRKQQAIMKRLGNIIKKAHANQWVLSHHDNSKGS